MNKTGITNDDILARLKTVEDPELKRSIVELGMVDKIDYSKGNLELLIKLTIPGCPLKSRIDSDVRKVLADLTEIKQIKISFSSMTEEERKNLTRKMTGKDPSELFARKGVGNVILVASGKGGVGKSTVSANLAVATAQMGYKVGLLDADIYGFSIPRILNLDGNPTVIDNAIIPLEKYGLRVISMGFFIDEDKAVVWRGPMIHKAVSQFLSDVFWDGLDFLYVDLPPGTGDVAISLAQIVGEANAVIVTTPQPGAYFVASRFAELAEKVSIKTIGIIENMSYFLAPDGSRNEIFGSGGGMELSEKLKAPLLGQIPLETAVRSHGDNGEPIVLAENHSLAADEIKNIAGKIVKMLKSDRQNIIQSDNIEAKSIS